MADRCDLTDLIVEWCACPEHRGGEDPTAAGIETVGQPITAAYEGQCARCAGLIEPGQVIARVADVPGAYVHIPECP